MNVELRRRTSPLVPPPAVANDNLEALRAPIGPRAVIYRPAKSAMTSGRARTKQWILEFEPQSAPFVEPLMGWAGSADPLAHVRLCFPTREAAIAYAERQGLAYELRERSAGSVPQKQPAAVPFELPQREPAYAAMQTSQAA
jgi:ETC complex I subunit conserved region